MQRGIFFVNEFYPGHHLNYTSVDAIEHVKEKQQFMVFTLTN